MKNRQSLALILTGAVLIIAGGFLALQFYAFDLGFFEVTIWRDVIIFSAIAVVGVILLTFGVRNLRREAPRAS